MKKKELQGAAAPEGLRFRCSCMAVLADLRSLLQTLRRRVLARQRGRTTWPLHVLSAATLAAGPPKRHWRTRWAQR